MFSSNLTLKTPPGFSLPDSIHGVSQQYSSLILSGGEFPAFMAGKVYASLGIPVPLPRLELTVLTLPNNPTGVYGFTGDKEVLKSFPFLQMDQSCQFVRAGEILLDFVETLQEPHHLVLHLPYYGKQSVGSLEVWKSRNWIRPVSPPRPYGHAGFWMRWDALMGGHYAELGD